MAFGLITASQPAVAPTGNASDAAAVKNARDNAGAQVIVSLAGGAVGKVVVDALRVKQPKIQGGRFGDIPTRAGYDRHEIPSQSMLRERGLAEKGEAPAVHTPTRLHSKTGSYGFGPAASKYRNTELQLLNEGKYEDAFQMGVDNLRVAMQKHHNFLKKLALKRKIWNAE